MADEKEDLWSRSLEPSLQEHAVRERAVVEERFSLFRSFSELPFLGFRRRCGTSLPQ